jgi:uncharacterized protein YbjQ (UPF0145 family)
MPKYRIEVEGQDGARDVLLRTYDHPEEARAVLRRGDIDESSGLRVSYKVIRISEQEESIEEKTANIGIIEKARASGDWSEVSLDVIVDLAANIVLTTAMSVAGREIEREISIMTAECIYGMSIFRDIFASVRDVVGGRSVATQKLFREARRTALAELRREALMARADAVIGINMSYQELSAGGKAGGMIMLVVSGTAVTLAPKK